MQSQLKKIISKAMQTKEPYKGSSGAGYFNGNFDWHSSVHAHWALKFLDPSFNIDLDQVYKELEYLQSHPDFERPYGRAWLSLLFKDIDFKNDLKEEMLDWLKGSPFPENDGKFVGTHASWLFSFFLMSLVEDSKNLQSLYEDKFKPQLKKLYRYDEKLDLDHWNFIDFTALAATVELLNGHSIKGFVLKRLQERTEDFINSDFEDLDDGDAHMPGRFAMLLWPYALMGHSNFDLILEKFEYSPHLWAEDFKNFSHWIPQFIVMGLYLKILKSC